MRAEGRLLHIGRVHAHLMVAAAEVDLAKELRALELVEELVDHRDGVFVLDGALVESTVVDAEPPRSIMLLDK